MSGVERLWREDRKYLGPEMLFKPCLRRRVHAAFANHFYYDASQFAVDCVPGPLLLRYQPVRIGRNRPHFLARRQAVGRGPLAVPQLLPLTPSHPVPENTAPPASLTRTNPPLPT